MRWGWSRTTRGHASVSESYVDHTRARGIRGKHSAHKPREFMQEDRCAFGGINNPHFADKGLRFTVEIIKDRYEHGSTFRKADEDNGRATSGDPCIPVGQRRLAQVLWQLRGHARPPHDRKGG